MAGKVYFDVGGTRFTTTWDTLQKIPGSRLEKLYEVHEQQTKSTGKVEYFFDRNPAVFGCILDYHRTGDLHLPVSVCPSQIRLELEFWDISPHAVSSCCWKSLYGDDGLEKTLKMLDREIPVFTTGKKFIQKTEGLTSLIRDLMEYPTSSMLAKAYAVFYLTMVVFSVICDALVRSQDYFAPQQNANISGSGSDHLMPSLSTIPCAGLVIEVLTNAVFTVDVVIRLAVSSSKVYFLKSFINILDMLALLGFWILVFTALISPLLVPGSEKDALMAGNLLMTLRYIRLYRLATVNRGLKLVLLALDKSKKTIFLLFAIMIINSCIFGGIVYCLDDNPELIHVFRAFYWAIITMTTVGYGDVYPTSTVGRIVASLCAMTGLFLLAMPIGIISKNFTYLYTRLLHREHHCKEKRKFKKTIKFTSLPNGDARVMS
ncbi:potassium voltage-gated channel protein egl-36-like [Mizuhopecten yessoensis]|uniref:potassium voltage-gated channel protein egl-36-like n=1 Tax=Mizuhopecten yessoensis TaxID=6573 RepID=UPI000B457B6A|nr:potassium voltage-gated channel protein egl-36-like [Mizuhopecten yessoensis]XP_021361737.1 potassium voltage-gated channel protein egl-36-like [Mizuhopecten yessoensis]XP_021361746.1 potassium voltage-gated channel protein egl-36-like [Mizuhopecten yessoensis]